MAESSAGIAEISCRKNAAIGEGIACFDFPIKQSVPAQGMHKGQIKHDRDFNRDNRNKNNLEPPWFSAKARWRFQIPANYSKRNTNDADQRLQKQAAGKKTEDPQEQRNRTCSKKPRERDLFGKIQPHGATHEQSQQAVTGGEQRSECAEKSKRIHPFSAVDTISSPEPSTLPAGNQAGRARRHKTTAATFSGLIRDSSLSGWAPSISHKRTACGDARYAVVIPRPELNASPLRTIMTIGLDMGIDSNIESKFFDTPSFPVANFK